LAKWRHGAVQIWDAESGEILRTLPEHSKPVNFIIFSADGKKIVVYYGHGEFGEFFVWDVESGKALNKWIGPRFVLFTSVALSPDGKKIVAGCNAGKVRVWKLE
jgi:WD40 repeat protein